MATALHLIDEGHGFPVVLGHALGCDHSMWDEVANILVKDFRVIRFDQLGHGRSPDLSKGMRIEAFTDAVFTTLSELKISSCFYAGVSMGAMVGLDLASRYSHIFTGMVLANTTHYYEESARKMWAQRIDTVTKNGLSPIIDMAIDRWLSACFQADVPNEVKKLRTVLEGMKPDNYAAACEAVSHIDFRHKLRDLKKPILLIAGEQDVATPPAMLEHLHQEIASSQIKYLSAGHLSAVEQPIEFANAIKQFHIQTLQLGST